MIGVRPVKRNWWIATAKFNGKKFVYFGRSMREAAIKRQRDMEARLMQ